MPYRKNAELPDSVQARLPQHAQDLYRAVFNHAWNEYRNPAKRYLGGVNEQAAHHVAWIAVKEKYEKKETGKAA